MAVTCDDFDTSGISSSTRTQPINGDPVQLSGTEAKPSDVVYFRGNGPIFGFFVC